MTVMKTYRNKGAIGALLDEYEKSIAELKACINDISNTDLIKIVDPVTKDKDCVSIQAILCHVVRAGYYYADAIRNHQGESVVYKQSDIKSSIAEYKKGLDKMFEYNVQLFKDYPNLKLEESRESKKIKSAWGQTYDTEQLLEHAIVHVLRHRRQIERFLLILNSK